MCSIEAFSAGQIESRAEKKGIPHILHPCNSFQLPSGGDPNTIPDQMRFLILPVSFGSIPRSPTSETSLGWCPDWRGIPSACLIHLTWLRRNPKSWLAVNSIQEFLALSVKLNSAALTWLLSVLSATDLNQSFGKSKALPHASAPSSPQWPDTTPARLLSPHQSACWPLYFPPLTLDPTTCRDTALELFHISEHQRGSCLGPGCSQETGQHSQLGRTKVPLPSGINGSCC